MRTLIVIDMQNDFVGGVLGTPEARAIVPNVKKKIQEYKENSEMIFATQDTHYDNYLDTVEGKHLPVKHCIANTDGWQLHDEIYDELRQSNANYILKHTFGSLELINELKKYVPDDEKEQNEWTFELIGLCLDACVISNAVLIKTYFPNVQVLINLDCTAGITPEKFSVAKNILSSLQIGECHV